MRILIIMIAVVVGALVIRRLTSTNGRCEDRVIDPGNDPRFRAAEEEARTRWPEFVAALSKREPNAAYAVKAKLTDGPTVEWMWVQVESINGESIAGTVDNDPDRVRNVKAGDRVTLKLADIDDWILARDGEVVLGGFTSKVLEQIHEEAAQRR